MLVPMPQVALIEELPPPDHAYRAFAPSPHFSKNASSNSCRLPSRATFCGLLEESETQKVPEPS